MIIQFIIRMLKLILNFRPLGIVIKVISKFKVVKLRKLAKNVNQNWDFFFSQVSQVASSTIYT